MSAEPHEIRLKRLRIRSWRRGMKEMDLLLGPFSDGPIAALSHAELKMTKTFIGGSAAQAPCQTTMRQLLRASRNHEIRRSLRQI